MPFHLPRVDILQASLMASYHGRPKRKRTADLALRDVIVNAEHLTAPLSIVPITTPTNPFDLLPVELQVEVLDYCLPTFPSLSHDEHEALVILTHVCRSWRSLVLSTPRFWSSFQILVGPTASLGFTRTSRALEAWLTRSRQFPLSIRVQIEQSRGLNGVHGYGLTQADGLGGGGGGGALSAGGSVGSSMRNRVVDEQQHFTETIVRRLITESKRWRRVEFDLPAQTFASILAAAPSAFPDGLPALRSFTLHVKGLWGASSSALKSTGSAFTDLSLMGIPWNSLSELDLSMASDHLLTLDECVNVLGQAVGLTRCTLNVEPTMRHHESLSSSSHSPLSLHPSISVDSDDHDSKLVLSSEPDLRIVNLPNLESLEFVVQASPNAGLAGGSTPNSTSIGSGVAPHHSAHTSPEEQFVRFLHLLSTPRLKALSIRWLLPSRPRPYDATWNTAGTTSPPDATHPADSDEDSSHEDHSDDPWTSVHPHFVSYLRDVANTNARLESLTLAYLPLRNDTQLIELLSGVSNSLRHLDLRYSLAGSMDDGSDLVTKRLFAALSMSRRTAQGMSSPSSSRSFLNLPILVPSTVDAVGTGMYSFSWTHPHCPLVAGFGKRSPSPSPNSPTSAPPSPRLSSPTSPSALSPDFSLLPRLASLRIQCSGQGFDSSDLGEFVQARWNKPTSTSQTPSPFRSFHLLSMEPVDEAFGKRIRGWRKEGLDISVEALNV